MTPTTITARPLVAARLGPGRTVWDRTTCASCAREKADRLAANARAAHLHRLLLQMEDRAAASRRETADLERTISRLSADLQARP